MRRVGVEKGGGKGSGGSRCLGVYETRLQSSNIAFCVWTFQLDDDAKAAEKHRRSKLVEGTDANSPRFEGGIGSAGAPEGGSRPISFDLGRDA